MIWVEKLILRLWFGWTDSSMDPELHFSVQSFKLYRDLDMSPCFLLLHLLFHSVVSPLFPCSHAGSTSLRAILSCLPSARSPSSIDRPCCRTFRTEARCSSSPTSRSHAVQHAVSSSTVTSSLVSSRSLTLYDLTCQRCPTCSRTRTSPVQSASSATPSQTRFVPLAPHHLPPSPLPTSQLTFSRFRPTQLIFISAMAFLDERVTFELSKLIDGLGMAPGSYQANLADGTKTPTATRLLRSFADTKLDVSVTALKKLTS